METTGKLCQTPACQFLFLPELIRIVINTAMQVERQKYLGVGPYECSCKRKGHANGFKPKTVNTRIAPITFDIPQVREAGFYPQALEKGLRSERALMLALAEMYVQGVFARKVAAITERLYGAALIPLEIVVDHVHNHTFPLKDYQVSMLAQKINSSDFISRNNTLPKAGFSII